MKQITEHASENVCIMLVVNKVFFFNYSVIFKKELLIFQKEGH